MESQVDITFYDFTHRNVIEWINNEKLLYMKTTFKLVNYKSYEYCDTSVISKDFVHVCTYTYI